MTKIEYEDIEFLTSILRKLNSDEATTLLSIIIQLIEDSKNE